MNAWIRLGYPPRSWIVAAVSLVCLADLFAVVGTRGIIPGTSTWASSLLWLVSITIAFFGAVLAAFRVGRFPKPQSEYANFLYRSSWHNSKHLPFGPWSLLWQDIPVLTVIGLLAAVHGRAAIHFDVESFGVIHIPGLVTLLIGPAVTFLVAWLCVSYTQIRAFWPGSLYVIVVCMALIGHAFATAYPLGLTVVVTLVALGLWTTTQHMRGMLRRLPESFASPLSSPSMLNAARMGTFFAVGPKFEPVFKDYFDRCTFRHATRYALLTGLWVALLARYFEPQFATSVVALCVSLVALLRLFAWIGFLHPPGISARFGSRRFVLLRFDRVVVPSLLMALCAWGIRYVAVAGLIPHIVAAPAIAVLAIFLCFAANPDVNEWFLTTPGNLAPLRPQQTKSRLNRPITRSEST